MLNTRNLKAKKEKKGKKLEQKKLIKNKEGPREKIHNNKLKNWSKYIKENIVNNINGPK